MNPNHPDLPLEPPNRLEDLLADHALFGLDHAERAELKRLGVDPDSAADDLSLLAADLQLAMLPAELEPLPPELARKLSTLAINPQLAPTVAPRVSESRQVLTVAFAAACLVLLAFGLFLPVRPAAIPTPSASELRAALLRNAGDVKQVTWTATGEAHGPQAAGDVVWSTARQEGYLRFRNLQINDPTIEQYQLWIFDENQDERYPIDGGVFDLTSNGEVIVRIHPKLHVTRPTLFAITVEKPGGVVVSDRSKLPLLAKFATSDG